MIVVVTTQLFDRLARFQGTHNKNFRSEVFLKSSTIKTENDLA